VATHKFVVTVLAFCVVVAGMGVVWQVTEVKASQQSVETTPAVTADTSAPTKQPIETNQSAKAAGANTTAPARARDAETKSVPAKQNQSATSDTRSGTTEPSDYDTDGIADGNDRCPTRPETVNGFQDGDGCPDVVKETGAS